MKINTFNLHFKGHIHRNSDMKHALLLVVLSQYDITCKECSACNGDGISHKKVNLTDKLINISFSTF